MGVKLDPAVVAAVRTAVAQDPANHALRLHLGRLLLETGAWEEAIFECVHVIARTPEQTEALALAGEAAEKGGDERRAAAFRKMRAALEPASAAAGALDPTGSASKPEARAASRDIPVRLDVIQGGKTAARADGASEDDVDVEAPSVRLADVGGLAHVKRRLETAFLGPMKNPALVRAFGKSLRGGLLLYGPPGCGKTFIARAVAGELGARFIAVGLHDVLDMWLGQSQRNLHAIFQDARRHAPCVLFFDEIDALGRKRSEARASGTRDVVVQLLAELDSFGSDNEGVFVLAATNHPWDVDAALRRPGRLDRTVLVLPPDEEARLVILRYYLAEKPKDDAIDYAALVRRTKHFSGADLAHLCETATEHALEESLALGAARPIRMSDLERALGEVAPSTLEWLTLSRNYAQFANEAGLYDDLIAYLRSEGLA